MRRILSRALAAGALAAGCMATSANAKVSVLIERDTPINSSLQAGLYEFASVDDYIAGTDATFRESAFLLSDYFSFGGLNIASDGKVTLLVERDTPINSSLQAGLYEFASVDDYIAGTGATFRESAFLLSDYFSFGGLNIASDGKVTLLVERDTPINSSLQAGLYEFASVDDYIAGTGATFRESAFLLSDYFSFGGLNIASDGKVTLLVERDTPINSSLQAGFYEFASVDDYIAGTGATFRESAFLLSDYFSFGGLSITDDSGPAGAVPEPTTWALMILGFGLAGGAMRRRAPLRGR